MSADQSGRVLSPLDEAKALLAAEGYMVVKIPECRYGERQHGRHGLVTRTAMCPGSEVLPHGYSGYHLGSFGGWIRCKCGSEFRDYGTEDERHWDVHKATHNIDTTIGRPDV